MTNFSGDLVAWRHASCQRRGSDVVTVSSMAEGHTVQTAWRTTCMTGVVTVNRAQLVWRTNYQTGDLELLLVDGAR